MKHFVYLIISLHKKKLITYVGYTNNIQKRLKLHNTSKGAKFTRGRKWEIIYKRKYKTHGNVYADTKQKSTMSTGSNG